jgi:hypothetical protein
MVLLVMKIAKGHGALAQRRARLLPIEYSQKHKLKVVLVLPVLMQSTASLVMINVQPMLIAKGHGAIAQRRARLLPFEYSQKLKLKVVLVLLVLLELTASLAMINV